VEVISIKYPYIDILIFSMLPERIYGRRMLRAGAKGFLSKSAPVHEMKRAFDMIFKSRRYISAAMVEFLADDIRNNKPAEPFNALSPREFEIMKELVSGNSLNVIAKRLNLRPSTVGTYKARIFEKLQVQNIFELKDMAVLYDLA
jgi:two-component system, NarL family, invasion response regulator UvrY